MLVATRLAFLALIALDAVVPRVAEAVALIGIATVGIGHGAVDHVIPQRLGLRWQPLIVAAAYGAAVIAAFFFSLHHTASIFLALGVLSWLHFGLADAATWRTSARLDASRAVTLGLVPAALLLVRPEWRMAALAAATAALAMLWAIDARNGRRWSRTLLLDLAALLGGIAVASWPFVLVAYFTAWHAPRHIARIVAMPSSGGPERFARFVRDAAPLTAAAIALAVLASLSAVRTPGATASNFLAALILAVTLPHQAIVACMDRAAARQAWQWETKG